MMAENGEQLALILEESLMLSIAEAMRHVDIMRRLGTYECGGTTMIWEAVVERIGDVFAVGDRIGFDRQRFRDACGVHPRWEEQG